MEPIGTEETSPFINPPEAEKVLANELCYARWDKYPVSEGHLLIVPYRQVRTYFDAAPKEKEAIWALVEEAKCFLDARFHPDGYNVGINVGEAAGQTVMHLHVHLIPRYAGDTEEPRGGVRGVIPSKQKY